TETGGTGCRHYNLVRAGGRAVSHPQVIRPVCGTIPAEQNLVAEHDPSERENREQFLCAGRRGADVINAQLSESRTRHSCKPEAESRALRPAYVGLRANPFFPGSRSPSATRRAVASSIVCCNRAAKAWRSRPGAIGSSISTRIVPG